MPTNSHETLNALPTLLAYPGLLAGYRTIDETVNDHLFSNYLRALIQQDMLASAGITDQPEESIEAFIRQFTSNADSLASLCSDGISKLPLLLLPTLLDALTKNGDVHRMAFLLAAYGHYLASTCDSIEADKPTTESGFPQGDWAKITSSDALAFLHISAFASARLHNYPHFVAMYKSYRTQIDQYGVVFLLKQMAYNQMALQ
ncbi:MULTISPECIES: hypothetical protein [unclassified Spirosoma]|uniref:mannitol dehydrogenase family protein n=1 Tax=unclassified Spirosoma TaxID=2621999 RepID=UPI000962C79A|nr:MULTISPECIES: hypothetical protein [unclassified Spirosoma]MBN8821954.1 hypothetical protein [Spirosoma sp.]OJW80367.1 MAG: hypothetical protein BGO59_33290 [Spirosoma sp. 48-14]